MICPQCNGPTTIRDTRYRGRLRKTFRRHICKSETCGFRFSTHEVMESDFDQMEKEARKMAKLRKLMKLELEEDQ